MKFISPAFLYALLAIAIPIIIHLFNFRRFKKVYFTNVRFLKEVQLETQSKSRLKHLLVLFSRILALSFLVFAFAQPYIPAEGTVTRGNTAVSIYIDNSFSMDAVNRNGTLLDEARKRAQEITASYKATDRFQLITNDLEGRHQRLVNKEEFLELLDEVKISPAVKKLSEVLPRQLDMLNNSGAENKKAFWLSDFQKSITDIDLLKNDTTVEVLPFLISAQQSSNKWVDSCWFTTPVRQSGKTEQLNVRIKNLSSQAAENNSVKLFINGQQRTPASYSIEPDGQKDVVLSFASRETGIQSCRIEMDDYPVTFDDKFYLSFSVAQHIPVMCIRSSGSSSASVASVFSDSLFRYTESEEGKLDYSALKSNSLIVLSELKTISSGLAQELSRFVNNGGSLVVFPHPESDLKSYASFLPTVSAGIYEANDTANTKVDQINYEQEIYKDIFEKQDPRIDLPFVSSHFRISRSTRSGEESLLKMQNGHVFLARYSHGKGKVYLNAAPLQTESSNWTRHALFLPTLFRIAIYSQPEQKLYYVLGKDEVVETISESSGTEEVYHLSGEGNFDIIPEHRTEASRTNIFLHGQVSQAGNYLLKKGSTPVMGVSFNYDRKESNLECYNNEELLGQIIEQGLSNFRLLETGAMTLTQTLSDSFQDKKLWKWCILLALLFLLTEVLLLRFMK